ncbi:universal stress protein [Ectothiorhodospiraceae bacterium 2226]|nr:universal stress protein [Ectothiorhodospiraceae bacterium 2226]
MNLQRILCPVDFSRASEAAADYAAAIAQPLGATVGLVHAVYAEPAGSYGQNLDLDALYTAMRGEALSRMQRLQVRLGPSGVPTETILREGPVAQELQAAIGAWPADLVVMATHGRRGVRRWVLGSAALDLLQGLRVPLLTLGQAQEQQARSRLAHVVAAVDFPLAPQASVLEAAARFATLRGGRLTVLHVMHELGVGARRPYEEVLVDALAQRLAAALPDEVQGRVEVSVEPGRLGERVLDWAARENVDLLVLGARPREPQARLLAGATVERLLCAASCPVLTVPCGTAGASL